MAIQAIQTKYKGYRFRSRLEARWAVFFDTLGIEWEYEKEGYQLSQIPLPPFEGAYRDEKKEDVFYLPDFYLPQFNCFVEVKNARPTQDEEIKAVRLVYYTQKNLLFVGAIPNESELGGIRLYEDSYIGEFISYEHNLENLACSQYYTNDFNHGWIGWDVPYYFCACTYCGKLSIQYQGRSERINCCSDNDREHKTYNYGSKRFFDAYRKARSARFEHGE